MDAKEFVQRVALESYAASKADPAAFWKLSAALENMNRVPEYIALQRLNYDPLVSRTALAAASGDVRQQYAQLQLVQDATDTLKHGRRHVGGKVVASSTGISPDNADTWVLDDGSTSLNLRDILDSAAAFLPNIPELK